MMSAWIRRATLLACALTALAAPAACTLNPQPLPPGTTSDQGGGVDATAGPADAGHAQGTGSGGSSGAFGGSSSGPTIPSAGDSGLGEDAAGLADASTDGVMGVQAEDAAADAPTADAPATGDAFAGDDGRSATEEGE
jgi:hypothetical protein